MSAEVIESRGADPGQSYVASLHRRGLDVMLKKLEEEASETEIATKNPDRAALVSETTLWLHSLVVLSACELHLDDLLNERARRFGLSGITEKAARTEAG